MVMGFTITLQSWGVVQKPVVTWELRSNLKAGNNRIVCFLNQEMSLCEVVKRGERERREKEKEKEKDVRKEGRRRWGVEEKLLFITYNFI